jgi:hypothetical protein
MDPNVQHELRQLQAYAGGCHESARATGREDIVPSARSYIGGALTTMVHLNLLTQEEHTEWSRRLEAVLQDGPNN